MAALRTWIDACRPKTLVAAAVPVAVGGAVIWAYGEEVNGLSLCLVLAYCLAFALCVQVACNFANDLGDTLRGADTSARVGPRRAVANGDITPAQMQLGIWIACVLALVVGSPVGLLSPWLALAGVLAIALTYGGMLGKVYAEILESGESHATQSLMRNGVGRLQAFFYALLPSHAAELASYTVYRWECAIRSSVVLGFVGAGGLGQQLDNSMKMFNGGEVATLLLVFIALVALADRVSAWLRKALA